LPFITEIPIWQAPTGSVAGPELAIAVSAAGGMGAMALTWAPLEQAVEAVHKVRSATQQPFLVNFALAFSPTALPAVLEAGAPIITFSWGDPTPYLAQVRSAGAKIGVQVTNVAGAHRFAALGVDFLICQGIEAGGHVQATSSLWEILPRIVEAADGLPVIAAGGIGNGEEIARALRLGAAAAMLGTRFVATQESRAHPAYKQRLVEALMEEAALTVCFDGGWPYAAHRVLRNSTLEAWEAVGCPPSGRRPGEGDVIASTATGEPIVRYEDTAPRLGFTGDVLSMCLYAGTSCGSIFDIPPAGELVKRLWEECQEVQHLDL